MPPKKRKDEDDDESNKRKKKKEASNGDSGETSTPDEPTDSVASDNVNDVVRFNCQ